MSSFTYPGKDRLAPRLRRFVGGMLIAGSLVATFLLVKPLLDPKTFDALLFLTPLSKDKFGSLLANPWAGLLAFVSLSWLVSKWVAVDVLEFHLFPWFDEDTLRTVDEKTGLLRWVDFEDTPAHEASSALRAWLSNGVHDGDWLIRWVLRGHPALKEKAFSYALLLGPNGVGKSQLVREAAREKLGVRLRAGVDPRRGGAFSRSRRALARWLRRVLPRMARLADDPWHVGEIVPLGDWSERLKAWRPSAPTVLILDDPYAALSRDVIDILDRNSGQFWYSVKLIIVDQFTPSGLELEPIGRIRRDHLGREIPILSIPDLPWTGDQARRAFSGGVWVSGAAGEMRFDPAIDISEFWQTANLERLSRALDGNPLMLAEAAIWLAARNARGRPYRAVGALLSLPDPEAFEQQVFNGRLTDEYRSEIAHRILTERVDEVFASHLAWAREMRLDEAAVVEALCCATLAGGAPLSAFEVFSKVQGPRLEKWIVRDFGETALLPPVGAWPVGEAFIERALVDFRVLRFEALVRRALAVNPVGLARQFTRKGRLARRLFEEMARLEDDEPSSSSFALNLFEIAAARAMWNDREAVPHALALLEKLPVSELARTQAELAALGAANGRVPDVLVAALLLTALGARRFAGKADWDWPAWETFYPLWTRWLRRIGSDLNFVPQALRDRFTADASQLYEALFVAAGKLNDPVRVFELLADVLDEAPNGALLEAIPLDEAMPIASWPALFRCLFVLKGISWDEQAIAADSERARRRADAAAAAAKDRLPLEADPRQRAFVETYLLSRRVKLETEAGGELSDLKALGAEIDALSRDFPHDRYFARRRMFRMTFILQKLKETNGDASLAWAQAEAVEAICKPFLYDEACVGYLIWCWGYTLGISGAADDEAVDGVIARLRCYASAFPNSAEIPAALARALHLRMEALGELGESETTEARLLSLASQAETVGREAPEFANVQWSRANASLTLARMWKSDDKRGLKIAAIARNVDAFVQPFRDNVFQIIRLDVWQVHAHFESRNGVTPGEAERIAHRITWAAAPFRGAAGISDVVALAWEAAVFGWHRDTREWAACERALRRLDNWVADSRLSAAGAYAQLSAWGSLLVVHIKRRDFEAVARLEPDALDRANAACAALPDDATIGEWAAYVFAEVAQARRDRNAGREALEELSARTRTLAAHFPSALSIQKNSDFVDRVLLGQAANTPLSRPGFPAAIRPEIVGQVSPAGPDRAASGSPAP